MHQTIHIAEILGIGMPELLIVLAIVLLLFGGKKIPELAKSVGRSVRELKDTVGEVKEVKGELRSPSIEGSPSASGVNSRSQAEKETA